MKISAAISLGFLLAVVGPTTQKHIAPRIIGGDEAKAGQFPYAAAIYIKKELSTTFCGGALLSKLWVLTAGHCVDGAISTIVYLGSTTLQDHDPNRIMLTTDNHVIHPLYNRTTLEHDIGLILFRMPITFSDYIMPTSFFPVADLPGSAPVTTFGWGQIDDEHAGITNNLRYVRLSTLTNDECKLVYGSRITSNMVCVSGNYNEGICRGDSGSPLIQTVGGGHTLIVGVGSFLSENGCESTDPSGFTRVFPYRDWIKNVTSIV
ncbi:brachyurin-like [Tribolium madens]|uniref:brachyurin-like n=1 Tax=Tribolium madens TaxID=41895 RepID=UPI001CF73131|nr:brachyurin-like [Tribolium madens]